MSRAKQSIGTRLSRIVLALLFGPALLVIILPLALLAILSRVLNRLAVYLLVWALWLPQGKDVLLVLSDSPIWRDYMFDEVLPLVRHRAVVLNWSERKRWPRWSLARHAFRSFKTDRNYNPLILVFRPFRRAKVIRFWQAFQEWKHGHKESVEALKCELTAAL